MNINGCIWCGHLERGHAQRHDGQHPKGRWGYTSPTDEIRKARLKQWLEETRKQHAAVLRRLEDK